MPRKAKITAVPVEQEQQGVSEDPVEQKTDAEQMTDIINEVNTAPQSDVPQLNAEEEVAEKSLPDGGQTKGPKPKAEAEGTGEAITLSWPKCAVEAQCH